MLWTDETKFEYFGIKRKVYVRRKPGERLYDECVVLTVKHCSGNVIVWGCFAGERAGDFIQVKGIVKNSIIRICKYMLSCVLLFLRVRYLITCFDFLH